MGLALVAPVTRSQGVLETICDGPRFDGQLQVEVLSLSKRQDSHGITCSTTIQQYISETTHFASVNKLLSVQGHFFSQVPEEPKIRMVTLIVVFFFYFRAKLMYTLTNYAYKYEQYQVNKNTSTRSIILHTL